MSLAPSTNLVSSFFNLTGSRPSTFIYSQFVRKTSHDEAFSLLSRTGSEVARRVKKLACFLRRAGVKPGDAVAIISATRPEWLEADMAILAVGGVSVSVYPSLLESEIAYLLFDSGAQVVFAENQEQLNKVTALVEKSIQIPATEEKEISEQRVRIRQIITFEVTHFHPLVENFSSALTEDEASFDENWYRNISADTLASLVYTSGTTGPQKGVMQTHGNHLANIEQARLGGLYKEGSKIFLLLPLAHSFAKLMGYVGFVAGAHLQFPSISDTATSKANQRRTLLDLSQSSCDVIPLVPRILEKMKEAIEAQASKRGIKNALIRLTLQAARQRQGGNILPLLGKLIFCATKKLRLAIKQRLFGAHFAYVISGGAKLPIEVNRFFDGLEIEVLEGYGLTETCVATNCNRPGQKRIGTVGPLLAPDIELKLSEEGEILFRGPNVAKGYLNRPAATAKSWDPEGWFHTGDLGTVSADGFLTISGRKKEIIVTSGGKKIGPEPIEERFKKCPFVAQALMFGEAHPYCIVLLTPNRERIAELLPEWRVETVDQALNDPRFVELLQKLLLEVNTGLASFESVKKILLLKNEFTLDNAALTPTLKMKRTFIAQQFYTEIEKVYAGSAAVSRESTF